MFGLALCAGVGITSCSSDLDDPMDTIPYNRVLTPMNFEAEVVATKGTDVTFSWSAVQNASAYVLELFDAVVTTEQGPDGKDVEVFNPPVYEATSPVYSFEVAADQVPYTVEGLEVDKTFYARVRGVSGSVAASHWAYLIEPVSTSAVRQLLNPVVIARTASSVTVGWDDAEDKGDLTSIRVEAVVPAEGESARTIALSDEQKNACEIEVSELAACRNYKFTLLFGRSGSRGVVTAWTRTDTEGMNEINSAEGLYNAINGATGDVKLVLAYNDGVAYDMGAYAVVGTEGLYEPFTVACNLSIYGDATGEGQMPVIKGFSLKTAAGCGSLHFEEVVMDGANLCGVLATTGGSNMTDVEFVNMEMSGYVKGVWSGAEGSNVDNFLFDGVYAHDINPNGSGGGDFIDVRGGDYQSIVLKNSTFYASARSFLRISEDKTKVLGSVELANCTFNSVTTTISSSNNSGIFHIRKVTPGAFTMSKCVFLNMNNDNETENGFWVRMARDNAENFVPFCSGNIYYNVGHMYAGKNGDQNTFFPTKSVNLNGDAFTTALAMADGGMMLEEDPCTNSIAGKMYLKNGVIAANKAGDPRWWDATQPVVVRPTELTTVVEPTVWDFTDKTKFSSETIETNQIIENIRIYAPAELVMSEGVTFASAASVDKQGRPTSSALGIRVQGVGAVEVTTVDAGFNAALQLVVAGDRYTMLADGKTHKVVLGDLVGENDIYLLAGSAVTVTKVAWTDDLTPEATVAQLAAPEVKVDNTSFDEGTEVAVTASWAAVENAASYEVTFQGKKTETTETSFTIDAATVAALGVATYEISVVAKPVATSSKYSASEAGVATFKVNKVILAGFSTVTWNFLTFDGTNLADGATWTSNTAFAENVVWTINPDFPMTIMNGVTVQAAGSTNGAKTADGSSFQTSAPDKRAVYFTATAPGKLKYTAKSGNSSTARSTYVAVSTASEYKVVYTSDPAIEEKTYEVDLMDLVGGETIYIFGKGNTFSVIEWTYVDENAGPVAEPAVWNFTDSGFDPYFNIIANAVGLGTDYKEPYEQVWDGLTISNGGGNSIRVNGTSERYVQMGGGGGIAENQRHFSFEAPVSGKVTVVASNTGGSAATDRLVAVEYGTNVSTQVGGVPSSERATLTFDIDITEATTVYVYPTNGLRFYSIAYTPNN